MKLPTPKHPSSPPPPNPTPIAQRPTPLLPPTPNAERPTPSPIPMNEKKTSSIAGRRPELAECLEAWWRVADSPAGRIFPDAPHGKPGDTARLCDAFDLYCWRLVCEAVSACKVRDVPPTRLAKLLAHVQCGASFEIGRASCRERV